MPMNINLTPHLEEMIRRKIESGSYNSASEVVREALRLLEQEDQLRNLKLQKLRHDIQDGLDSGPFSAFRAGTNQAQRTREKSEDKVSVTTSHFAAGGYRPDRHLELHCR